MEYNLLKMAKGCALQRIIGWAMVPFIYFFMKNEIFNGDIYWIGKFTNIFSFNASAVSGLAYIGSMIFIAIGTSFIGKSLVKNFCMIPACISGAYKDDLAVGFGGLFYIIITSLLHIIMSIGGAMLYSCLAIYGSGMAGIFLFKKIVAKMNFFPEADPEETAMEFGIIIIAAIFAVFTATAIISDIKEIAADNGD